MTDGGCSGEFQMTAAANEKVSQGTAVVQVVKLGEFAASYFGGI